MKVWKVLIKRILSTFIEVDKSAIKFFCYKKKGLEKKGYPK